MPIGVAVIDANLLVPIVACDFLLTAFDHGVFEPIVSTSVLDEVERTLIDTFPHIDPGGLRRRVEHMRAALADQTVDATGFVGANGGDQRQGPSCRCRRPGRGGDLGCHRGWRAQIRDRRFGAGSRTVDGNGFAMRLWEASPADVSEVIHSLIAKRRRPAVSAQKMARQLSVHFPEMAAAWLAQCDDRPKIGLDH